MFLGIFGISTYQYINIYWQIDCLPEICNSLELDANVWSSDFWSTFLRKLFLDFWKDTLMHIEFEVFLIASYCEHKRKDRIFPTIIPMKDGKKLIYATKKIYVVLREVANAVSSSTMGWNKFLKNNLPCICVFTRYCFSSFLKMWLDCLKYWLVWGSFLSSMGSFNVYVDKIWSFFYHLLTPM